ncbi:Mv-ORF59 peptide [Maruca vitrata nucleopolyhedrovirus]|uniref:Mv-ORF59 peptide n=1 Tax=Maruca vitrata nucleopolyhedrovirus TaxID=1307954 RepID=A1YRC1_9ABAC|nr:Mv-ORF59 peptide [Maruca vitrata nucleopolyhedrovirus]ABL76011.1 Mv-ORF59 peptide [Maruca vitrata nucleopolyhedrovirus]
MNLYLLLGALAIFSLVYDKKENSIFLYLLILLLVFIIVSPAIISKNTESDVDNIPSHKAKSVRKKLEIEQALDAILNKNTSSID